LIPEPKGTELLFLSPLLFKEGLKKAVVAAAADEARPTLSGVLFWREGPKLRIAATDSYRLAEVQYLLATGREKTEAPTKVIIPQRAAHELLRLLEGATETVSMVVTENQALFATPSFLLVSRLIEGEFPKYADIIPKEGKTTVQLPTEELLRTVKVASLFAREAGNHITLTVHPKGEVVVKAASPQVGEHETRLPATATGEEQSVSFNARFLQDAAASIATKEVEILLTGKTSPALFREEGNRDFLHLVMPLRLDG